MLLNKLLFLIFLSISSNISIIKCQDTITCIREFNVVNETGKLVSFGQSESDPNLLLLVIGVSESVEVDDVLYSIVWQNSTTAMVNDSDSNTALDYVKYNAEEYDLSVVVTNSMSGIVDYNNPDREESLQLTLYFDAFTDIPDLSCIINITHEIQDENTAKPHFDLDLYWTYIREDYPIDTVIPDLQPMAFDFDQTSPNNVFSVETSPDDCPLAALEESYMCEEGMPVVVTFVLKEMVDYDVLNYPYQINCNILLKDSGTPSMMTDSTVITINVTPWADEDLLFSSDFYSGYVTDSFEGATVPVTPVIGAVDPDMPPPHVIIYTMYPPDDAVDGTEYFSMNSSTAEITLSQDLDAEFLSTNEIINFIIEACDDEGQCSQSFLAITLPLISTSDSLYFEKITYTTQVATPPPTDDVLLQLHAQSTFYQDNVIYYFDDDGSSGLFYFSINETSGEISATSTTISPGFYEMTAMANDTSMTTEAMVTIQVVTELTDMVFLDQSFVEVSVEENKSPIEIHTMTALGGFYFCILDVDPLYFKDYFSVDENGTVSVSKKLDADLYGTLVKVKAGAYDKINTECLSTSRNPILSNEVLIEVTIIDVNDNPPYFVDPTGDGPVMELLFAYPEEITLQRAIGPVAKVMGRDNDTNSTLSYMLSPINGHSMDAFAIDYSSGEIYLVGELIETKFVVKASDTPEMTSVNSVTVNIAILPQSNIFTMIFDKLNQSEVEGKITEVSMAIGVPVYLLYSTLVDKMADDDFWQIEAQVYSTSDMELVTMDEFVKFLDNSGVVTNVTSFTDSENFVTLEQETTGYKTATIVLGCLCGLLIVIAGAMIIHKMFFKTKRGKKGGMNINTLGKAYENEEFKDDNNEPSFATIFGNNPVEGTVLSDERRRSSTPASSKRGSGSQGPSSPKSDTDRGKDETSADVHQKEHKSTTSDASEKMTREKF